MDNNHTHDQAAPEPATHNLEFVAERETRVSGTVADYIAALSRLPGDLPIYNSWEGTLLAHVTIEEAHVLVNGDHARVDYYPELDTDEGETRIRAVVIR